MKMRLLALAVFISLTSMLANAGTTCATSTIKAADGTKNDFDFVPGSGDLFYQFRAVAGRSYSVEVLQDYDDQNTDLVVTVANPTSACPSLTADTGLVDTTGTEPAVPANAFRYSVPTSSAGDYHIQIHDNTATGHYVAVTISDTTYFSANWSTFLGYITEWVWLNTTNSDIHGKLTIIDNQGPNGTSSITIPVHSLTVPKGAQASLLIGPGFTVNVGVNHGGYAIFTHDGPPGALVTTAFFVNLGNGLLIGTPFAPTRSGSHP
jgi:hypothetical protein